jgi:hypothetical protein
MRRNKLLSLAILLLLGAACGLSALGLDLELKGGGGMAMGTTDDSNKSGELRYALDAGLSLDVFLLKLGSLSLGLSGGAGYANLHYHGVDPGLVDPFDFTPTTQTSDSAYNYVVFPVALVGKLGSRHSLTLRAGGFAGYFLSGTSDLTYSPETTVFNDGEATLDETNTEQWMYGLSFYAGVDLFSRGRLSITPSLEFNLGLTDTSVDSMQPTPSNDTFWALTANVGIRYRLLQ